MGGLILADLVRDWGNFLLENITITLYQSELFRTILYLATIVAFVRLASDLSNGIKPVKAGIFFAGWLFVMPVNNRPVFYYVINTFSVATSHLFQTAMHKALTVGDTKKVMPPGFVFNSIIKAQTATISDASIRADVLVLIDYCLPDVKNKSGEPLTAMDLFGGKVSYSEEEINFTEFNFEPSLLSNRKITANDGSNSDCLTLLKSTRKRLRSHLLAQSQPDENSEIYVGPNNGEFNSQDGYVTTWDSDSPDAKIVATVSANLAEAHAVQKVILEDYFSFPEMSSMGKSSESVGAMSPLTSLSSSAFSGDRVTIFGRDLDPTRVVANLANFPTALAKSLNLDGALDAGLTLQEMNERLIKLPYYVSNVQLILKLLAPLVIFLLLFPQAWGLVVAWSMAWFASLLVPAILMFSRSVANLIIIWVTKLNHVTAANIGDPAFLNTGVSFEASNRLMKDAGYWMSIFLEIENGAWNGLFMILPIVGGVLVQWKGNQFMKKMGESSAHNTGREVSRQSMSASGSVAKGAASKLAPYAASGAGYAASVATQSFKGVTKFVKGKV